MSLRHTRTCTYKKSITRPNIHFTCTVVILRIYIHSHNCIYAHVTIDIRRREIRNGVHAHIHFCVMLIRVYYHSQLHTVILRPGLSIHAYCMCILYMEALCSLQFLLVSALSIGFVYLLQGEAVTTVQL